LLYVVFYNESNKSIGVQNSYQQHVDYGQLVASCGFLTAPAVIDMVEGFEQTATESKQQDSWYFIHVKCSYDDASSQLQDSKLVFKGTDGH
jgi:hypothetical protein